MIRSNDMVYCSKLQAIDCTPTNSSSEKGCHVVVVGNQILTTLAAYAAFSSGSCLEVTAISRKRVKC